MLLHQKLEKYNIILGSKSPRRRQLLADLGFEFSVAIDYSCDESYPFDMDQLSVPEYIANNKAEAYPLALAENELLITADTLVLLDGRILGKPADRSEAIEMVTALSGNSHSVITAVAVRSYDKQRSFSVTSEVIFRELSHEEIVYYVDTFRPFDKAGSYGIQEWIGYVGIERINGSFFNVMGLPTQRLYTFLDEFIGE